MMIAARLAGGNLFLPFLWWRIFLVGDFGSTRSSSEQLGALGFFLRGILWWGIFGSTRSTRIFFEGILLGGILFFCGGWGVFWIVSVGKD